MKDKSLTIFSFPRPFVDFDKGQFKTIQENAIMSWKLVYPEAEIILFGDEQGTQDICKKLKLRNVPDASVNNYGTPYLNNLFEHAQEIANSDVLCYLHSDIVVIDNMMPVIKVTKNRFNRFLILARRWDLFTEWKGTVKESEELFLGAIDFNNLDWKKDLEQILHDKGMLRHPGSCDCYIFSKGLYPQGHIPAFLLGRQLWDGWIIFDAPDRGIPSVDASAFKILHQSHTRHKWGLLPQSQWEEEGRNNSLLAAKRKRKVDQTPYFWEYNELKKRS